MVREANPLPRGKRGLIGHRFPNVDASREASLTYLTAVDQSLISDLLLRGHHDLHHAQAGWNYGLYFTWWDRLMGAEHPNITRASPRSRKEAAS